MLCAGESISMSTRLSLVAYDPPMSAAGEQASAQSTSAENGFIVSNPFPFTETASGNKDHSAFQFKPNVDHHATVDPGINLDSIPKHHLLQHPADNLLHIPAQRQRPSRTRNRQRQGYLSAAER
jgi:hypothetical protein